MNKQLSKFLSTLAILGVSAGFALNANAAGGVVKDINAPVPDRYVYYPGTEQLGKDEIRVTACGTGMPASRRGQAASCWLMEFGNGERLLFDLGTGSMANVAAMMIPYQYLDKVFLSHLHTDHMGDIAPLWAGGWTAGRPNALKVWGPSGATPEMGTKYAMEHFLKYVNWDKTTREYKITPVPGQIEVHEFDYKAENEVIYDEGGIVIRSWPAIHAGDGPVSFGIEYAGKKVVFGGDTVPNKWMVKFAKDADLLIHEAMMLPEHYLKWYNQPAQLTTRVCCEFHTSPQSFGKIMSTVQPKHAVAYHFFNEEAIRYDIYMGIRETYNGPLSMADDLMVWNVTSEGVTERMAVVTENAWSVPGTARQSPPQKGRPSPMTDAMNKGRWEEGFRAQDEMLDAYFKEKGIEKFDWRPKMYEEMKKAN